MTEASKQQVGGTHYKLLSPQPAEFCYKNGLNNLQSEAISYILRCRHKDGGKNALTDLDKAIHTLQMWKEFFDFGHEPVPEITFPSNVYQDHEHLFQEQVSAVAVIANISYTEPANVFFEKEWFDSQVDTAILLCEKIKERVSE